MNNTDFLFNFLDKNDIVRHRNQYYFISDDRIINIQNYVPILRMMLCNILVEKIRYLDTDKSIFNIDSTIGEDIVKSMLDFQILLMDQIILSNFMIEISEFNRNENIIKLI